jgi:hypothetical protein
MLKYLLIITFFYTSIGLFSQVQDSIQKSRDSVYIANYEHNLYNWRKMKNRYYFIKGALDYNMIPAHLRFFAEPGYCTDMAYANDPNIKCNEGPHLSLSDMQSFNLYLGNYNQTVMRQNEVRAYNKGYALRGNSTPRVRNNEQNSYSDNSNGSYKNYNNSFNNNNSSNTVRSNNSITNNVVKRADPNRGNTMTRPTQNKLSK